MSENMVHTQAKYWQLILWPLNSTINNVMNVLIMFLSYIAVGGYGVAVVVAGVIATNTRIFDAVTDPLIAIITDRMSTRFGKIRISLWIGFLITSLSMLTLFVWGIGQGLVFYTIVYVLYYVGSTFNSVAINTGNAVLTKDPKQRPLIFRWNMVYVVLIATFTSVFLSNVLLPRHGELSIAALQELCYMVVGLCLVFAILATIAISDKDKMENFPQKVGGKVNFKDAWNLLRHNRALQILIITGTTDKVAQQAGAQSVINVMIFGIIIGNYEFFGIYNMIAAIPTLLVLFYATNRAGKTGTKKALIKWTTFTIIFSLATIVYMALIDPTLISSSLFPTIVFILLAGTYNACMMSTAAFISAMQPDIVDYELYRSGNYLPGTVASIYNLIDKTVSSLGATITAVAIASIGYQTVQPQPTDPSTPALFWVAMFLWQGISVLGYIVTLIVMKWYPLDKEKMEEVQSHNKTLYSKTLAKYRKNIDSGKDKTINT